MAIGTIEKRRPAKEVSPDQFIDRQLRRTQLQVRLVDIVASLAVWLVAMLASLLVLAICDHWLVSIGTFGRWLALITLVAGSGYYLATQLGPLVLRRINSAYAAKVIEDAEPGLKNSLLNFLLLRGNHAGVPDVVVDAMRQRAAADLSHAPVDQAVDRAPLIRLGYVLCGVMVAFVAYKFLSPKDPFRTVARVLAPWAEIARPSRVMIAKVTPGDADVFQGQVVSIAAEVEGVRQSDAVELVYSTADGQTVDAIVPMPGSSALHYSCQLPQGTESNGLQQDIVYRVRAGDAESPPYRLHVLPSPRIEVERIELHFPAYTRRQSQTLENQGDVRAVEGTRAIVHAKANQEIASAYLEFDPSKEAGRALTLSMQSQGTTASGEFRLERLRDGAARHTSYQVRFLSLAGVQNDRPTVHRIEAIADLAPEIEVLAPMQRRLELPADRTLTFELRGRDPDFGLRKIALELSTAGEALEPVSLLDHPQGQTGPANVTFTVAPKKLRLQPGDELSLVAIAEDNRHDSAGNPAPNVSRTDRYRIRITEPEARETPPGDKADASEAPENGSERRPRDEGNDSTPNSTKPKEPRESEKPQDTPEDEKTSDNPSGEQKQPNSKPESSKTESSKTKEQENQSGGEKKQQQSGSEGGEEGTEQESSSEEKGSESSGGEGESGGSSSKKQQGGSGKSGSQSPGDQSSEGESGSEGASTSNGSKSGRSGSKSQPGSESSEGENAPNDAAGNEGSEGNSGKPTSSQQAGNDNSKAGAGQPQDEQGTASQRPMHDGEIIEELNRLRQQQGKSEQQEKTGESAGTQQKSAGEQSGDKGQENAGEPSTSQKSGTPKPGEGQAGKTGEKQQPAVGEQGSKTGEPGGEDEKSPSEEKSKPPGAQQSSSGVQSDDTGKAAASEKPGDTSQPGGEKPEDNATSKTGGQGQQGDPGSGRTPNDPKPSGEPQVPGRDTPKTPKPENGKPKSDEPSASPSSKKQSDSQGESPGDETGGGGAGPGQPAKQKGNDTPGSSTSADEGAGASNEAGKGETGSEAGGSEKADGATGKSGNEQGPGSKSKPGEQGSKASPNEAGSQEGGAGQQAERGQNAKRDSSKQGATNGPATGGGVPSEGDVQSSNTPPKEVADTEAENLEYAKKSTDLALKYLKDQKDNPDPELLKRLGWTKDDLDAFVRRWEALKSSAKEGGDTQAELDDAYRSLGLRPAEDKRRRAAAGDDAGRSLRDAGARSEPPPGYADQYKAFRKAAGQKK